MKFYNCVIEKLETNNYKKGVTRLDTSSGYYKTGRVLYFLSLIWFGLFHILYLFANTAAIISSPRAAENIDNALYTVSWINLIILLIGLVSTILKVHLVALPLNTLACVLQMRYLYLNEEVNTYGFLENGILNNKYFWFHFAPAILIILFSLILLIISLKTYIHFRKDYSATVSSMYDNYLETHPTVSGVEWQEYLKELDEKEGNNKSKLWLF